MNIVEAKKIIKALADGINPITGEVLPKESPYNEPDVIRALFTTLEYNEHDKTHKPAKTLEQKQQANLENGRPKNAGLPWTENLRAEVASKFQAGITIKEICDHFERSKNSIEQELKRQGLIEDDEIEQR